MIRAGGVCDPHARRPALVLIHGGKYDSRCWQPTVDAIERSAPQVRVITPNLPGRQRIPGDLRALTVGQCVASIVRQIEAAGVDHVVLVAHSLAGIIVPGVAAELGSCRVRRIVFVACNVPRQGTSVLSNLSPPIRFFARMATDRLPLSMSRWMFCGGMTPAQHRFAGEVLVPEATTLIREPVDRSRMPSDIRRTWVLTRNDRTVSVRHQRRFIRNLGGVREVIEMHTCHNAMISQSSKLASILTSRL
ncbi:alpha/beta hydrolase [Mycobacterium mantenii]|uniref:alpha/beta fold hydrolase n=1 Tax=Mycobacterium mantenii TaxID=560555 RepID=UPI001301F96D|nr:alpha/beta hydrolase [Mycobacterium mantenii]MCV7241642.1 alpha/beta hydrolase [Mycobacterium mantenii]